MEFECNIEGSLKRFIISIIPCCMVKVSEHVDAVGYRLSSEKCSVGDLRNPSGGIVLAPQIHKYTLDGALDYQPEIFPDLLYHRLSLTIMA